MIHQIQKMKVKIISFLLALFMTAALISCSDKDKNTAPESSGDILYYFVGGHLVGSLEDGRFISATDREKDYSDKDRYRLYTIAELFSEKSRYYRIYGNHGTGKKYRQCR